MKDNYVVHFIWGFSDEILNKRLERVMNEIKTNGKTVKKITHKKFIDPDGEEYNRKDMFHLLGKSEDNKILTCITIEED